MLISIYIREIVVLGIISNKNCFCVYKKMVHLLMDVVSNQAY